MTWLQRYQLRSFVRQSLWVLPVCSIPLGIGAARLLYWIDLKTGWELDMSPEAARTVLGALTSSLLTFIVFVFTMLLVAVQLSSAQLTPRIIAVMFQDRVTKLALTVFVFGFTLSLVVLARIEDKVPRFSALLAAYFSLLCIAVFIFMIDHVGRSLRPVAILTRVGNRGHQVFDQVYPQRLGEGGAAVEPTFKPSAAHSQTLTSRGAGVVLAFDEEGLTALAERSDCLIELVPQVGDFIAPGDPLFHVYGGQVDMASLRQSIAIGAERTTEQDPAFVFRIIVDIAAKALSPAINDPTTGVLALDQIHHLLRQVGTRRLDNGQVRGPTGQLRFVYRTPDWSDFVYLAVTEIRQYGSQSVQIARRLRAMLENLVQALPPQRGELLRRELEILQRSVARAFAEPEDQVRAATSDRQGVGGSRPANGAPGD